jgi:hypothetical protein
VGSNGGSPQTVVFFRGTDGSNPSPSSSKSAAKPTSVSLRDRDRSALSSSSQGTRTLQSGVRRRAAGALDRAVDLLKGFRGEDAVVADALDFEQSMVRAEAFNPPTFVS